MHKKLIIIFIILLLINFLNSYYNTKESVLFKLFNCSFLPWFYMFCLGIIVFKSKKIFKFILSIPIFLSLPLYIGTFVLFKDYGWGNKINALSYFLLVSIIIKFAFSYPKISEKLIGRNDISYGIYIYHMPVVNFLLANELVGQKSFLSLYYINFIFSIISWFLIEKKFLRLKVSQLRKV